MEVIGRKVYTMICVELLVMCFYEFVIPVELICLKGSESVELEILADTGEGEG